MWPDCVASNEDEFCAAHPFGHPYYRFCGVWVRLSGNDFVRTGDALLPCNGLFVSWPSRSRLLQNHVGGALSFCPTFGATQPKPCRSCGCASIGRNTQSRFSGCQHRGTEPPTTYTRLNFQAYPNLAIPPVVFPASELLVCRESVRLLEERFAPKTPLLDSCVVGALIVEVVECWKSQCAGSGS